MKITKRKSALLGLAATTLLIVPGFTGCVYGPGGAYEGSPEEWDGVVADTAPEQVRVFVEITETDGDTILVKPEDGAWELNSSDAFSIPKDRLSDDIKPEVGMWLEVIYSGSINETYPASFSGISSISVAEYPGRRDTDTMQFDEEKTEGGVGQSNPGSNDDTIAVQMRVSHVTPTGLTVHFTQYDKRDCGELIYGEGYHLEVLNGDTWEDVPTIIEDWGFNSIGYTIPAEGEAEIETNWEWLYGKLSPGTYRITKILTDSNRNDPNAMIPAYPLTAQFMIAGDEL